MEFQTMQEKNEDGSQKTVNEMSAEELDDFLKALEVRLAKLSASSDGDELKKTDSLDFPFYTPPPRLRKPRALPIKPPVSANEKARAGFGFAARSTSRISALSDEEKDELKKIRDDFKKLYVSKANKFDEQLSEREDNDSFVEGYFPDDGVWHDLDDYLKIDTFGSALFEELGDVNRVQLFCEKHGIDPDLSMSFLAASKNTIKTSDPVAAEIAAEVTTRWLDRKKPENKGQPWAKGPIPFIKHWYGKWLEAGTLVRAHLRPDGQLYNAYIGYLRRCKDNGFLPEIDLVSEPRVYIDDPEAALKRRRKLTAESVRRSRENKIK